MSHPRPRPASHRRSLRRLAGRVLARLRQVSVEDAAVADRRLRLRLAGRGVRLGPGTAVALVGPRQRVDGVWRDATTVEFDLRQVPPYGVATTVLRPGSYVVQVEAGRGGVQVHSRLPHPLGYSDAELSVTLGPSSAGPVAVELTPTRRPEERGEAGRQRLRGGYKRALSTPLRDAVHLTCFDGRGTGDNVGPVAAELARRRPELRQCWTVADPSVELPAGASAALVRTAEWWQSQATARMVVVNCWLPVGFQPRPGQTILQTWHGTPYKTLGLDRLRDHDADDQKLAAGLRRHAGLWDLLLAQNAYSAGIFARAYGFDRDPLLVGYPRNDRLVAGFPADVLDRVRRRLGVADDTRLVLYAPTFRDDAPGLFRGLDLAALGAGLGPDHVILVRGHGNTVRHDRAVERPGVVDVTLYPDLTELFAVAEVMITDYSSAMFDFALTGKPLVFFVPDLERYTGSVRGSYFDLAAEAPGPLTGTTAETVDAVRAALAGERSTETARRYLHWQERYLSTEQGTATTRTVDALLALVDARS